MRHELVVRIAPETIEVDADVARLSQVFSNLLNNAATHSEPEGRIAVVAETAGGEVVVRVRDTGVGIAPDSLPGIFEMFAQGDHPVARPHRDARIEFLAQARMDLGVTQLEGRARQ